MDKLKDIDLNELNELVQMGVTAIGIVGCTFALMYFGLAMGY